MASDTRISVLIAEHSELQTDILGSALGDARFAVTTFSGSSSGLIGALGDAGVLLVGDSFPRAGLAEVVPRIVARGVRVMVLARDGLDEEASDLLLAGASGFLSTADAGLTDVADAIVTVAQGLSALNAATAHQVLKLWRQQRAGPLEPDHPAMATPPELTGRERDVLEALTDGLSNRLIAKRLGIAEKTVEAHKSKLFAKLGAQSQAHAVQLAVELDLG